MDESQLEEWRPVRGYEGWYEVSSLGRIKRVMPGPGCRVGKILKPTITSCGYLIVSLAKLGKAKNTMMHRILYEAFLSPIPEGLFINHIDGNKRNNALSNLEVVTASENSRHALAIGLAPSGEKSWNAKLSTEQVISIRKNGKVGSWATMARQYGSSPRTIRDILSGKRRVMAFEAG